MHLLVPIKHVAGALLGAWVSVAAAAPVTPYHCPVQDMAPQRVGVAEMALVTQALDAAFDAAVGPEAHRLDTVAARNRLSRRQLDRARMAALAEASGCAALLDRHASCSAYFDTELGDPLSVFMDMPRAAPLRRQFEAAVAGIRDRERRRAAQFCIALIGTR